MTSKVTLTIAIPAYNEEGNIAILLTSVLKQKVSGGTVDKICIISDGSTDRTNLIVKEFMRRHKSIQLVAHKKRKGKVARLNEIYRANKSQYLIVLDADILLANDRVISKMVASMQLHHRVTILAAHQIPTRSKTLVGKAIYAAYRIWDETRLAVPKQIHIQNFYGAATIYRGSFVQQLRIPSDITDERGYIYLKAIEQGEFSYNQKAVIYYHPVETLHDLWWLGDRSFSKNQDMLARIFGPRIYNLYQIPLKYKLRSIILNMTKSPLYTTLGLLLNVLIRVFPAHDKLYTAGMWEPSSSTKKALRI